ncbi:hypothetical protein [Ornithinibacillus halotolerans]|uniref:DUF4181 domain-containing protein n=1 Tax=Ornithinibacillus halotolerans TaxID=1274357 RepID=A0A916S8M6_9BACI|nr:hypothetical protein [Ornithinibacillus halotolerans]GGA89179.1 hypothetical protein GCM10008025_34750 [Ornithinibacillus halotolerans]
MFEIVSNNVEIYIIIYGLVILWINIDYLREHKKIQKGLEELSPEEEIFFNPNSFSVMVIGLLFNFIRRWLMYLIAITFIDNLILTIMLFVLFVVGLYDTLFNNSLPKVKKSKIGLYLAIIDTLWISFFIIYLVMQVI